MRRSGACLDIRGAGSRSLIIVAGDFNMSDASLIYDEIAAQMRRCLAQQPAMAPGRSWPVAEAIGLARG